jgi:hypothetical protein
MSPGARAGGGPVEVGLVRRPDPAIRRFRDRSIGPASQVRQCGAQPFSRSRPGSPACRPARLRGFNGSKVASVRRRSWLPFLHPAASRRRIESSSKIPSSFRVLPRPSEEPVPAIDKGKMLAVAESGNGKRVWLSTFAKIASGQRWITQLPAAITGTYPRSRFAKRRSLRALSLMKPSASCWS